MRFRRPGRRVRLPRGFDEEVYLEANPDVAAAVAAGRVASGAAHWRSDGRLEGRPLTPALSRNAIVRSTIDVTGRGLELGPLDRPVMPKREGYRVEIVDYLDAEGLRGHYGAGDVHEVDVAAIEDVDHVTGGRSLLEVVDGSGRYEWIVASHVIEHVPDPISFLHDVSTLLTPTGRLALVVPDKRYCFDVYGEITTAGHWIDAFAERRTRPTPGQVVDYFARVAAVDGAIAWGARDGVTPEPMYGTERMRDGHRRSLEGDTFGGEIHCWRFTPDSFRLLIADLRAVGLTDLGIVAEHDTLGIEFFVTLGRDAGPIDEHERRRLLSAAVDPARR